MKIVEKRPGYLKLINKENSYINIPMLILSFIILVLDLLFVFILIENYFTYDLIKLLAVLLIIVVLTALSLTFFFAKQLLEERWTFSDKLIITHITKRIFFKAKITDKEYALKDIVAVKCKQSLPDYSSFAESRYVFLSISLNTRKKIAILLVDTGNGNLFDQTCQIVDEIEHVLNYWGYSVKIVKKKMALVLT